MNEPWGMSGPQFLVAYLVALAVTTFLALILRSRVGTGTRTGQPPETVEEIAYLNGDRRLNGRARVVASAVAGLLERGVLRMSRDGRLQYAGGQPRTELEGRIVNEVHQYPDRSLLRLTGLPATDEIVDQVENALINKGLVTRPNYATVLLTALPLLVVTVTGMVRIINGLMLHRPVEALAWCHILTFICLVNTLKPMAVRRTRAGKQRTPTPPGAAGLVAVHGPQAFPNPEAARILQRTLKPLAKSRLDFISSDNHSTTHTSSGSGGNSCGG